MKRHRGDEMERSQAATTSRRHLLKVVLGGALVGGSLRGHEALGIGASESLSVPFASGTRGVTTSQAYAGWSRWRCPVMDGLRVARTRTPSTSSLTGPACP